jgi:hypothetical protein
VVKPRHFKFPLWPRLPVRGATLPPHTHTGVSAMAAEAAGEDLYAVLGVGRDASEEDIRRAYRSLAQAVHPDKHAGAALREVANAHFSRLHAAYEVLRRVAVRAIGSSQLRALNCS